MIARSRVVRTSMRGTDAVFHPVLPAIQRTSASAMAWRVSLASCGSTGTVAPRSARADRPAVRIAAITSTRNFEPAPAFEAITAPPFAMHCSRGRVYIKITPAISLLENRPNRRLFPSPLSTNKFLSTSSRLPPHRPSLECARRRRLDAGQQHTREEMMRVITSALALCAAIVMSTAAFAQVPANPNNPAEKVPEKLTYTPYGAPITLADAKKVAAAALAEATKRGWPMCIAVVQPSGDLVY